MSRIPMTTAWMAIRNLARSIPTLPNSTSYILLLVLVIYLPAYYTYLISSWHQTSHNTSQMLTLDS